MASMTALVKAISKEARLTSVAHELWTAYVQRGDTVVDATAGNGSDTLWLAKAVGPYGTVYAIDTEVKEMPFSCWLRCGQSRTNRVD